MKNVPIPGLQAVPPADMKPKPKPSNGAVFLQFLALLFVFPAITFSVFMAWSMASPEPCNDWSGLRGLGVVECLAVAVLVGLPTLAIGLFARKGSPTLRWICIVTALATWLPPIIAEGLFLKFHCR
jgi:hypothetical protein